MIFAIACGGGYRKAQTDDEEDCYTGTDDLKVGEGGIISFVFKKIEVYRDPQYNLHTNAAVCPLHFSNNIRAMHGSK